MAKDYISKAARGLIAGATALTMAGSSYAGGWPGEREEDQVPAYIKSQEERNLGKDLSQIYHTQAKVFPNNSKIGDSWDVPFRDAGRNFKNTLDNIFWDGSDVAYTTPSGMTYVAENDLHTFVDGLAGRNMRHIDGKFKGSDINWLGPASPYIGTPAVYLGRVFSGLLNSVTKGPGELVAGALNLVEGTTDLILSEPIEAATTKLGWVNPIDYAITYGDMTTQGLNSTIFEHIAGGSEFRRNQESIWNGITKGEWTPTYIGPRVDHMDNDRRSKDPMAGLITSEKTDFKEKLAGSEIIQKANTGAANWFRPVATVAVNAPLIYFITAGGSSSGGSSSGFDGGTGGPTGGFNPGTGGAVGQ